MFLSNLGVRLFGLVLGALAGLFAIAGALIWAPWTPGAEMPHGKASDGTRGPLAGGAPDEPTRSEAVGPRELLPDLITVPPRELYIVEGETREIRFSTTVANVGKGPLDIAGVYDEAASTTTATQRIEREDGSTSERLAGTFAFHPWHEHWHFEDFTVMEMWTLDRDGDLDELVASTGKSTFCAIDSEVFDESLPAAAEEPAFGTCGQGVQGISVGWSDTYEAALFGQSLDITGVADGRYALRSIVDPDDLLSETDNDNNETISPVVIEGGVIELLGG